MFSLYSTDGWMTLKAQKFCVWNGISILMVSISKHKDIKNVMGLKVEDPKGTFHNMILKVFIPVSKVYGENML